MAGRNGCSTRYASPNLLPEVTVFVDDRKQASGIAFSEGTSQQRGINVTTQKEIEL